MRKCSQSIKDLSNNNRGAVYSAPLNNEEEKTMSKKHSIHFMTSDGFKIDGFNNADEFTNAIREWEKKQAELNNNKEEEKNNEK